MTYTNKLEDERQIMLGNWGYRHFTNDFQVMLDGAKDFDLDLQNKKISKDIALKYEVVEMFGRVLRLMVEMDMTENEIFSIYQILSWKKREENKNDSNDKNGSKR